MAEPIAQPRQLTPRQIELAKRALAQRSRVARFTEVPARRRRSTKGERGETWRTKRHTAARQYPPRTEEEREAEAKRERRRTTIKQATINLIHALYERAA